MNILIIQYYGIYQNGATNIYHLVLSLYHLASCNVNKTFKGLLCPSYVNAAFCL